LISSFNLGTALIQIKAKKVKRNKDKQKKMGLLLSRKPKQAVIIGGEYKVTVENIDCKTIVFSIQKYKEN
jgi:hypothetical protein